MVTLEQVKLLESKVTRTIDYVKKVTEENARLKEKLDSYQGRIDELEVLIQRFREDQSRIEDGILSALDRLNQFEDALESKFPSESKLPLKDKSPAEGNASEESKASPGKNASAPAEEPEPLPEADNMPGEITPEPDHRSDGELDIF